jgi:TonB-linked SusC/RagA family outer membrane protein
MRTFIFLLCTTVFSLNSTESFAQDKVTIDVDKVVSVDEVFNIIQDQTEYRFIYPQDLFLNSPKITLTKGIIDIYSLLEKCFSGTDVNFKLSKNNTIVIEKSSPIIITDNNQQKILVSGIVKDQNGQLLPGATVLEKGTTNGTQTDFDGKFSLSVNNLESIIVVSYVGYVTQEINVSDKLFFDIVLQEDVAKLDEIVVVGYGKQKKVNVVGAVSDIKSKEILQTQTANIANNLTGRIAGLTINNRGGEPGSESISTLIRGISTTGNNTPLFVIDGIISRGSFERLNPEDIESISVLKDASAAIYGPSGANGVILVTTKRGKEGKPTFSFSQNYSVSQPTRRPYLMNARQYLTWIDEQNIRNNRPTEWQDIIRQYRNGTIDRSIWGDTDWWNVITDNWVPQLNFAANVSGGTESVKYYVSGQYLDQDALYVGRDYGYKQYNLRSNLDIQLSKNLKMGVDLAARIGDNSRPNLSTDQLVRQTFVQAPYDFPYYANGLIRRTTSGNPIPLVNGDSGNRRTQSKQFDTKFSFRWDMPFLTEGLYVDGYAAVDFYQTTRKDISNPYDVFEFNELTGEYDNLRELGQLSNITTLFQQYSEQLNKTLFFRAGYDKMFGKHNVSAFVAYEQLQIEGEYFFASRQGLISSDLPYLDFGSTENQNLGGLGILPTARRNYFGRLNYNYDNRYLLEFTFRRDGSAIFGPEVRYGNFPALLLGWRISNEKFFKSDLVTDLKLRASWASLGNDRVDPFQFQQFYTVITDSFIFGDDPVRNLGLTPGTTPNPNATWETSNKYNIGIDFTLKNQVLSGSIDAFYEIRSDILQKRNASVPVFTGLELPDENIGRADNRGFEIELKHRNNIGELNYSIGGQFSFAQSRILFIDEAANIPEWQRRTGSPIDFLLVYQADGIYNNQEEIDNSVHFPDAQPGDVRFVDVSGDGVLDENDQILLDRSPTPRITYGFNFGFNWKNFDLNLFFQGQGQAQTIYRPFDLNQQSQFFTQRWISERLTPDARFPAAYDLGNSSYQNVSTVWLRNNDFLRLKNIELSYSLGKVVTQKLGLKSCRVFVSANNLFLISDNVEINDPESTSSTGWVYPQQRLLSTGLNLTF